jgi:hypothetical protein
MVENIGSKLILREKSSINFRSIVLCRPHVTYGFMNIPEDILNEV